LHISAGERAAGRSQHQPNEEVVMPIIRQILGAKALRLAITSLLVSLAFTSLWHREAAAQSAPTKPRTPHELHQALASAFNARDLDRILALYEPNSALVPQPGEVATGKAKVREALKGFLAIPGQMQVQTTYVIQLDNIALTRAQWSIRDGGEIKIQKSGTEIVRQQPDGSWLFVIDHPFGAEPMEIAKK
jgi:uncharacterized protein (TIGR02246 family)